MQVADPHKVMTGHTTIGETSNILAVSSLVIVRHHVDISCKHILNSALHYTIQLRWTQADY